MFPGNTIVEPGSLNCHVCDVKKTSGLFGRNSLPDIDFWVGVHDVAVGDPVGSGVA